MTLRQRDHRPRAHRAEVGPVAQDRQHGHLSPGPFRFGAVATLVEPAGDDLRAEDAGLHMPAMTRSMMVARSNSANTPSICTIIRLAGVAVSNGSVAERKATPAASSSSSTCEPAHRPGEPVDAADQQQVEASRARLGQRTAEVGPLQGGAADLVGDADP